MVFHKLRTQKLSPLSKKVERGEVQLPSQSYSRLQFQSQPQLQTQLPSVKLPPVPELQAIPGTVKQSSTPSPSASAPDLTSAFVHSTASATSSPSTATSINGFALNSLEAPQQSSPSPSPSSASPLSEATLLQSHRPFRSPTPFPDLSSSLKSDQGIIPAAGPQQASVDEIDLARARARFPKITPDPIFACDSEQGSHCAESDSHHPVLSCSQSSGQGSEQPSSKGEIKPQSQTQNQPSSQPSGHSPTQGHHQAPNQPSSQPITSSQATANPASGAPTMAFWPQYTYVPYASWAYHPYQICHQPYPQPAQYAPPAQRSPFEQFRYFYPTQQQAPQPQALPPAPPPAVQLPALQPGQVPWYGRTRQQIDEDNRRMAALPGGANSPHEIVPHDPGDDRQFWVVELNGTRSLHSYQTIESSMRPGRWIQNPQHGNAYFVRERA